MIMDRVAVRVSTHVCARAFARRRVLDDLADARPGAIDHQNDAVGEQNRLVDNVGDNEAGLTRRSAHCQQLFLRPPRRQASTIRPEMRSLVESGCMPRYALRMYLDRDSLLGVLSIVERLDAGWRPGDAELEGARYVERWTILPRREDGNLFRLIGIAWSPPVRIELIAAPVIALDRNGRWARLRDEWVTTGAPDGAIPAIDPDVIRAASGEWLSTALAATVAAGLVCRDRELHERG